MSFVRPTLSQLVDRARDDVNARLTGADSRLSRSVLGVLTTVAMGAVNGLYGFLDYLSRQILPDTADAEHLERHASIRGIYRKPATLATGTLTATGTDGAVIPDGTVLQRLKGVEYVVQAAATIAGGTANVAVAARAPGMAGAAEAGTRLAFVSPIAGVASSALVAGDGLGGAADQESDDLLRARLLARLRQTPSGGALHDYEAWALEVPEVTRAWIYRGWMGAGTVGVAFVLDGRENPIPLSADIEAVEDHLAALAPVTADVVVFAPTPTPLNLTISGLSPGDAGTRAAVAEELRDLLIREAAPGGTILLSHLREAISLAAGEADHVLTAPIANVTHGPGALAVLGAITWL